MRAYQRKDSERTAVHKGEGKEDGSLQKTPLLYNKTHWKLVFKGIYIRGFRISIQNLMETNQ